MSAVLETPTPSVEAEMKPIPYDFPYDEHKANIAVALEQLTQLKNDRMRVLYRAPIVMEVANAKKEGETQSAAEPRYAVTIHYVASPVIYKILCETLKVDLPVDEKWKKELSKYSGRTKAEVYGQRCLDHLTAEQVKLVLDTIGDLRLNKPRAEKTEAAEPVAAVHSSPVPSVTVPASTENERVSGTISALNDLYGF